jgi:hypothetical protein
MVVPVMDEAIWTVALPPERSAGEAFACAIASRTFDNETNARAVRCMVSERQRVGFQPVNGNEITPSGGNKSKQGRSKLWSQAMMIGSTAGISQ